MNCFNHPDIAAIGLCKHCNKGLCRECATDLGHGLACKNTHEAAVQQINAIIERSSKMVGMASSHHLFLPLFFGFIGVTFVGWGLLAATRTTFPLLMGVGFLVFGIITYVINRKARAQSLRA